MYLLNKCRHPNVENLLGLPERTNEAAGAYARACIAVAEDCGIPVVDLWNKMLEFPDWKKAYLRYTLHFLAYRGGLVFTIFFFLFTSALTLPLVT